MGCEIENVKYIMFFLKLVFELCGMDIMIDGEMKYENIEKDE